MFRRTGRTAETGPTADCPVLERTQQIAAVQSSNRHIVTGPMIPSAIPNRTQPRGQGSGGGKSGLGANIGIQRRALRQPACRASASEQNQRSPSPTEIFVRP